jgi:hypothetical protein
LNQFQRQQKAWYSLLIHVEYEINSNDSKKYGILYLFILMMEPIPTTATSMTFLTFLCGGWNQFQQLQKGWYTLLINSEDGTNFNDRKKRGILHLFMRRIEPIPAQKEWYS